MVKVGCPRSTYILDWFGYEIIHISFHLLFLHHLVFPYTSEYVRERCQTFSSFSSIFLYSVSMEIALYMQRFAFELQTAHLFILIYAEIRFRALDCPLIHLKAEILATSLRNKKKMRENRVCYVSLKTE